MAIKTVSEQFLKKVKYRDFIFVELNEDYIFKLYKDGLMKCEINELLNQKNTIILLNYEIIIRNNLSSSPIYFVEKIGNTKIKNISVIEKFKNVKQMILKDIENNKYIIQL
jgi:hypothetical protein